MNLSEVKESIEKNHIKCLECSGTFSAPKYFLTMFKTTIGPYSGAVGYGRPEAAQGIFVEFKRLYEQARERLPIGFASIGHALRNEISPRQGPLRLREFTIIDLEFFIDPQNPQCPLLKDVADETLRLVLIRSRLSRSGTPVEVTVREALSKGYIRMEWEAFFMALAKRFLVNLGVPEDKQWFIEKFEWERAHYSVQGFDQEIYLDRWGWVEVSGFNYRTEYDLKKHMEGSGVDMRVFKAKGGETKTPEVKVKPVNARIGSVFKEETSRVIDLLSKVNPIELKLALEKEGFYKAGKFEILPEHVKFVHGETENKGRHFVPHVIEPSFGSDRLAYVTLEYAFTIKKGRTVLKLPRDIAPVQLAVLPLMRKDGLPERTRQLHNMLLSGDFTVEYDEAGSIGRRYARFDEIGTPLCLTVDYQTLEDETVTIRDRTSWKQVRTKITDLPRLLCDYFHFKIEFEDLDLTNEHKRQL
jgi:glycyl-tRNA synthetase